MDSRVVKLLILTLILVGGLKVAVAQAQGLPPPLPHAFLGAVEVNGQPAPVGALIEARGTGVKTGTANNPFTVTVAGRYGGPTSAELKLIAQGKDLQNGDPLEFYVDGVKAQCARPGQAWQDSFPFESGVVTELNLRVGAPAEPTATPTATTAPGVTVAPTTGIVAQATSGPTPTTGPAPTATRLTTGPTNTPVQGAAPTGQVAAPAATARPGSAATALPGPVVATPTGLAPQAAEPAASATPAVAPAAAASAAPTQAQAAVSATPLPTRTPAAVAQVVTSEPILKQGTPATPPTAAPSGPEAGSGRSVALWGGLGALLIAVAVVVFIKVRR